MEQKKLMPGLTNYFVFILLLLIIFMTIFVAFIDSK